MKGVLTMKRTRLLTILLTVALVFPTVLYTVPKALAASIPTVTVSNSEDLVAAIENAAESDVIGVDGKIAIEASVILGDENKKLTLQKVSPNSYIYINTGYSVSIQNITFDGAELEGTQAFLQSDSYAEVTNCTFQNHLSTGNGAVAIWNGEMKFTNCTFQNNSAFQGAAINVSGMCKADFESCTFKNNQATMGGGAITNNGEVVLKQCLLTENTADIGGAIRNNGLLTIEKSKIFKNTAEIGSDIASGASNTVTFSDSVAELNELYASDGFTAEWVKEFVSSSEYGDYVAWELVLTEIPSEPEQSEEPTEPSEPLTPTEPEESNQPISTTTTTNSSTENNPSASVRIDKPLGNIENNITVEPLSDDVLKAYITAYMTDSAKGSTTTPIQQTITVEGTEAGSDESGTLNINVNVGSNLQEEPNATDNKNYLSWYQVLILCLLVAILCFTISILLKPCYNYKIKNEMHEKYPKGQGGNAMFFSKKDKNTNEMNIMHYEGLQGFRQDFPCVARLDEESIIFENKEGFSVGLAYNKLQSVEYMPEQNFMGKYHNNPVSTAKMGVKWFYVIHYISSSGEAKYIAFWGVDTKTSKFFDALKAKVVPPTHIEL